MSTSPANSPPGLSISWTDYVVSVPNSPSGFLSTVSAALENPTYSIPSDSISRRLLSMYSPEIELPPVDMIPTPVLSQAFVDLVLEKLSEAERQSTPEELGFYMPSRFPKNRIAEFFADHIDEPGHTKSLIASVEFHHEKSLMAFEKKETKAHDANFELWLEEIDAMPTEALFAALLETRHPLKRSASVAFGDDVDTQGPSKMAKDTISRYASSANAHAAAVRALQTDSIRLEVLEKKCTDWFTIIRDSRVSHPADDMPFESADAMAQRHAEGRFNPGELEALESINNELAIRARADAEYDSDASSDLSEVDEDEFADFDANNVDLSRFVAKDADLRDDASDSDLSSCHGDDSDSESDDDDDESPAQALSITVSHERAKPVRQIGCVDFNINGHMMTPQLSQLLGV